MKKTKAKILFLIAVLLELIGNFLIYSLSAVFFGFSLKAINLGIAYAVWSGVGIVFLAIVSVFWFHLPLTTPDIIGLVLITTGVMGMDLFGAAED